MCNISMIRRYELTKDLITSKPGVYYDAKSMVAYWHEQTGVLVSETHVPAVFQNLQNEGGLLIHNANKSWCLETEEIRSARLAKEAEIKATKIRAQSEKDNVLWAKKRQKVQDLLAQLRAAQEDLKAFEDARQDSILRIAVA